MPEPTTAEAHNAPQIGHCAFHPVKPVRTQPSFKQNTIHRFSIRADQKYDIGQAEHGGDLCERPSLIEAENEIIDQMFYLASLRTRLKRVRRHLQSVRDWMFDRPADAERELNAALKIIMEETK